MRLDRDFLADRKGCGASRACVAATYVGALQGLHNYGAVAVVPAEVTAQTSAGSAPPRSTGLPAGPGQCTASAVSAIAPRLASGDGSAKSEDFDTGTSVSFADAVSQISYEREPKLIASKAAPQRSHASSRFRTIARKATIVVASPW